MQQTVESNRTLLVDGPASVKVVSGKAEVFSYPVKKDKKVVVREGKRLPFFVVEKAVFEISLGANAVMEETAGNTIPSSWSRPLERILKAPKKPVVILVLGKIDSGKSSYCTYLVNNLVDGKCRVAVLDGDLGQSDIGSSGTVNYAFTFKQIAEIYELKPENGFFVGVTSPMMAIGRTVEGLAAMKAEILQKPVDFVVVNTDGWVEGNIAVRYKTLLVTELKPDLIVGVQAANELYELVAQLAQPVVIVEVSSSLNQRSAEERKSLREMTYAKYLKDAKIQSYPKSQLVIEPRDALSRDQAPEKGSLVGLYGSGSRFLGIGVLREINQVRKALKVETAVFTKPMRIVIGKVCLDEKFREIQD